MGAHDRVKWRAEDGFALRRKGKSKRKADSRECGARRKSRAKAMFIARAFPKPQFLWLHGERIHAYCVGIATKGQELYESDGLRKASRNPLPVSRALCHLELVKPKVKVL
jgi:hypothetical protein